MSDRGDDSIDQITGLPWACHADGWLLTGLEVGELDEWSQGTWLVWTRGSQHIWNIDPPFVSWTRMPGKGRGEFVGDGELQRLTRVDRWPVVGKTFFLWFDDPDSPFTTEQWRQSTPVRRIERIESGG